MQIRPAEVHLDVLKKIVEEGPELITQKKTSTLSVGLLIIFSGLRALNKELEFGKWFSRAHWKHDIGPCVDYTLS